MTLAASPEASNQLSKDHGRQQRMPEDKHGPDIADQGEDTKAQTVDVIP
jgi:hypothetical protein